MAHESGLPRPDHLLPDAGHRWLCRHPTEQLPMTTAIAAPPRAERVQERVRGRSRLTHHALVPGAAIDPAALRVMLITEGTYPFHFGGVSTWCHGLVKSMPEVDFSLIAIIDA